MRYPVKGEVIEYNYTTAVAQVRIEDGTVVKMHAGGFFSGRPARLPEVGNKIIGQYVEQVGIVAARLQNGRDGLHETESPLVSQYLLSEAAMQLLASSTAQRYYYQAWILSRQAKLVTYPQRHLRERLQVLWARLMVPERDTRPVAEIEAALVLAGLWDQAKGKDLPQEFETVASFKRTKEFPGTEWLVALTEKLRES